MNEMIFLFLGLVIGFIAGYNRCKSVFIRALHIPKDGKYTITSVGLTRTDNEKR